MRLSCPGCRSSRTDPALVVRGWRVRRCRDCRTLFVVDPPSVGQTAELYGSGDYFIQQSIARGDGANVLGYGGDYVADREHIERKFSEVLVRMEQRCPPGLMLDVGAGPGFLLSAARRRGWEVRGIDVNPWAAAYARDELGIEVTTETLEEAGFDDASFDAVTMMDLVEHLGRPQDVIAEAARIIRPGGLLVILTPDAGSPVSRALGRRWPEVRRAPEHLALFSVSGLTSLLERQGFEPYGWHHIGKTSSLETLLADASLAAPRLFHLARELIAGTALGKVTVDLDPRTKFCLYSVRPADRARSDTTVRRTRHRAPRGARATRTTEEAILDELRALAARTKLCDWYFEQVRPHVRGSVVEVGAGIGTFSQRLLAAGAERLLVLEPEPGCASALAQKFRDDPRVALAREELPDSETLRKSPGDWDFVLCQNVLEHIEDHREATAVMAAALRPGGVLSLLVPAHPRLFGALDETYGHHRRYTPELARSVVAEAGLEPIDLHHFNLPGILGWWAKNRIGSTHVGPLSLRASEALAMAWRPIERRWRPPAGLSLVVHARRPQVSARA